MPLSFPVQAAAGAELQREERLALVLADLVDLDDVGVLQAGDGLRLGAEAVALVAPGMAAGQDHLESDEAVESELPRLVDDAHAAAADLLHDLVTGHGRQQERGRRWDGDRRRRGDVDRQERRRRRVRAAEGAGAAGDSGRSVAAAGSAAQCGGEAGHTGSSDRMDMSAVPCVRA